MECFLPTCVRFVLICFFSHNVYSIKVDPNSSETYLILLTFTTPPKALHSRETYTCFTSGDAETLTFYVDCQKLMIKQGHWFFNSLTITAFLNAKF